jgi:gluconate 2-dehydrogenase alpha chain
VIHVRALPEVDVCIVGLGAAGAMAAYVLATSDRRVVALEAGPPRNGREFAMDELQSSSIRNAWGAAKFNSELPTWRPNAQSPRRPTPYRQRMANGVGGSSLPWAAMSWRFHPDDFRARSGTVDRYGSAALAPRCALVDWPVSYDDLEPFYDEAEQLLGVSGQAGNVRGQMLPGGNPFEGPRQHHFPLPPLRTSGLGELFSQAAEACGYHPFPVPAAILSEPYQGRKACTYCSFCARTGCHVGARGNTLETVLPPALASGNLEVRTGCRARRVAVNGGGEGVGVEYEGRDGPVLQPAGVVIIASYTFENVRLLLLSRGRDFPRGLGNNSGQVGRYYMTRQHPDVFGLLEGRRLNRFVGPETQTIDDLNADNFDHAELGFIRGGRLSAARQPPPILGSSDVPPEIRRWGRSYKAFLAHNYNSIVALSVDPETLPYEANFLDLDPDVRDLLGLPVVRITFDIYENERRLIAFLQERALVLLRIMGADQVWRGSFAVEAISTHDVGGTRMGEDPSSSVVDSFGQLHEAPRVFVLGGSTFPTLPGLNPTLTIQALALRTAYHIAHRDPPM